MANFQEWTLVFKHFEFLGMTGRICTKDWPVPGDSFVIPKFTRVIIPIVSLLVIRFS